MCATFDAAENVGYAIVDGWELIEQAACVKRSYNEDAMATDVMGMEPRRNRGNYEDRKEGSR